MFASDVAFFGESNMRFWEQHLFYFIGRNIVLRVKLLYKSILPNYVVDSQADPVLFNPDTSKQSDVADQTRRDQAHIQVGQTDREQTQPRE